MKKQALPVAAAFLAFALSGGAAGASAQDKNVGIEDRHFVMHAVPAGIAEVEASKLAAEKAQNEQVKRFAQRMVTDHTKANDRLVQIAQKLGLRPPQEPGAADKAAMQQLQQLSGSQFDRAYMGGQVIDHDMAIYMYQRESRQGQNEEVKSFASQTLPTLREHHEMALEVSGQNLTAEQQQ